MNVQNVCGDLGGGNAISPRFKHHYYIEINLAAFRIRLLRLTCSFWSGHAKTLHGFICCVLLKESLKIKENSAK